MRLGVIDAGAGELRQRLGREPSGERRSTDRRGDVAALFNMIVRLADSLGWHVPTFEEFGPRADAMLSSGYALPQGADE
jgi:hypothetical protein